MDSLTLEQATERAVRGAIYLDKVRPKWDKQIDLASLNLASGSSCVLGQLEGCYYDGRESLFHSVRSAEAHGVEVAYNPNDGMGEFLLAMHSYLQLTLAWKELVRQRRTATEDLVLVA